MPSHKPEYSVIIPVYNSAGIVGRVIEQTIKFFEERQWSYELILVNDGSQDQSWNEIHQEAASRPHVTALNLMRNYGQHTAVYCGLENSVGEYVITIDDDLQNPPEEIIHLIKKLEDGHDVVFGRFRHKKHSGFRNVGSYLIRLVNNRIFRCPKEVVPTNFRLIQRDVVDRILQYRTAYPYITGLVLMFSNNIGNVWVEHEERLEGKSNYSLYKILSLVARILFNYSVWPLRIVTIIGIVISFLGFLIGVVLVFLRLFDQVQVEGWTGVMVMLAFFSGTIVLMLGMLGEYVVRILQQISAKEIYHVKDIVKYEA